MRVLVKKPFQLGGGKVAEVGKVVDLPDGLARLMINATVAEEVTDEEYVESRKRRPKAGDK